MGLCPDCRSEGETVSYVGASRADVVDGVEPGDGSDSERDGTEMEDAEVCDLCEEEYVADD